MCTISWALSSHVWPAPCAAYVPANNSTLNRTIAVSFRTDSCRFCFSSSHLFGLIIIIYGKLFNAADDNRLTYDSVWMESNIIARKSVVFFVIDQMFDASIHKFRKLFVRFSRDEMKLSRCRVLDIQMNVCAQFVVFQVQKLLDSRLSFICKHARHCHCSVVR